MTKEFRTKEQEAHNVKMKEFSEKLKKREAERKAAEKQEKEDAWNANQFISDFFNIPVTTLGGTVFKPQRKIDTSKYGK